MPTGRRVCCESRVEAESCTAAVAAAIAIRQYIDMVRKWVTDNNNKSGEAKERK